jgi:ligand-binding SRPBCC domain-containing protein
MEHIQETMLDIPKPRATVFGFFSQAANLERITPPELRFRIVTPEPIQMGEGTEIRYRLRLFGVPFGWTTRISEWDPPEAFTDEQVEGPYAVWIHRHRFERRGTGTRIVDRVRYRLPLGWMGEVAHPMARYQLGRIFSYRERAVWEALVGSEAGPN